MDIIWKLTPKNGNTNYTDLIIKISHNNDINLQDYNVEQVDSIVLSFKDKISDYILEHGLTSIIETELINEAIISRGESQNNIIKFLHKYIEKVGIDKELIIIDPYFYASTPDITYVDLVDLTLQKFIPLIEVIYIITDPRKVDPILKTIIENKLKYSKPSLQIIHKTSIEFHDRFWISNNREHGIITGTSLNGYGKKYSLIDRLNTSDVREIINILESSGLI
jgi:hypothetical protein